MTVTARALVIKAQGEVAAATLDLAAALAMMPPDPPPATGFGTAWVTNGTPRADQSQAGTAFASYSGSPGYAAASCAVYTAKAGDPVYTFNTGNLDPNIPIGKGTKAGGSNDRTLVIFDNATGRMHSVNGATYTAATDKWTCTGGVSLNLGQWSEPKSGKPNDSSSASRIAIGAGILTPSDIGQPPTHALRIRIATAGVGAPPCPYPANTTVGGPGGAHATFGWLMYLPQPVASTGDPLTDTVNNYLHVCGAVVTDGGSQITIDMLDPRNQDPTGSTVAAWAAVGVPLTVSGGLAIAKLSAVPWSKLQALNPPVA